MTNTDCIRATDKTGIRWAIDLNDMRGTRFENRMFFVHDTDPAKQSGDTTGDKLAFLAAKGWSNFKDATRR